jgi:tRNA (adenine58-N1)-methyltransferase non-catalytic subunit
MEVVSDLQATLRQDPQYLAPSVSESWLRRYQVLVDSIRAPTHTPTRLQVLPGRTHPLMTTSGGGGYLLHTTKVYVTSLVITSTGC